MLSKIKNSRIVFISLIIFIYTIPISAHCDTMEGPVVKASQKALQTGNINYVLIWVQPKDEHEIKNLYEKVLRVRKLNDEAKELADMYFFETVVRVHRMGEGEPYTGIKPAGYQPDEGIEAADVAIEKNSLTEILAQVPEESSNTVKELFTDLQSKMNYDINDLTAGRKYVEAYVHFIHYVESLFRGEDEPMKEHHH
jgi:hypothetical protein